MIGEERMRAEREVAQLKGELKAARDEVARLTHELAEARGSAPGAVRCGTKIPSAQRAVVEALERLGTKLPCGHELGDLTWAPGSVTTCGTCVSVRAKKKALGPDGGK